MRLPRALDEFWFAAMSPKPLALLRVIVGLAAFATLAPRFRLFLTVAGSSPSVFEPVGVAALLDAPIPQQMFVAMLVGTLIANLAFIAGWRFSFTGPVFAGLYLWVLTYRNSWSMIYHTDMLIVLHVLILGLTRSADTLSLDVRVGRGAMPDARGGRHWEYGYPIRLMCAVTATTYVLAGVAKVAGEAGWTWGLGGNLLAHVAFDNLRKDLLDQGGSPLAFMLYPYPWLFTVLGIGSLGLELGAPLALLSRRLAYGWACGVFGMHWGIYAIMGIIFWYPMLGLAFLPFVVDDRLVDLATRWRADVEQRLRTPAQGGDTWWRGPAGPMAADR